MKHSNVFIVPTSDHLMHMDNPSALANTIINDIYGTTLEVSPNKQTILMYEEKV